ncbi:hypothetical protein PSEUDO9AZ_40222 [Pseudomonas sp. 9AZ]|nr:hypothetical protein PSEUDO9AZ_40222 [Pseudomonas sp. 9AZ]
MPQSQELVPASEGAARVQLPSKDLNPRPAKLPNWQHLHWAYLDALLTEGSRFLYCRSAE